MHIAPFGICYGFLLRYYDILPNKELHWSLEVEQRVTSFELAIFCPPSSSVAAVQLGEGLLDEPRDSNRSELPKVGLMIYLSF